MEATPEVKQRPLGALSQWQRDFARAFAAAVPMERPARDPDAFRWIFIAGERGTPGYVREVIHAECHVEAWEKAELLLRLGHSLRDAAPALRPVTCKDMKHHSDLLGAPWMGEHDIRETDGRYEDITYGHFVCRHCGRCEWNAGDFAA